MSDRNRVFSKKEMDWRRRNTGVVQSKEVAKERRGLRGKIQFF